MLSQLQIFVDNQLENFSNQLQILVDNQLENLSNQLQQQSRHDMLI